MFYSDTILSRRGPLGKVWLAAHMERKLSKTQTLQTDIEQSVDAIMGQEIEIMALRLSGQLLLGVVRIYSRKAKYLLDDCNEALLKIKMAFRPGPVDLIDDELVVSKNSITLAPNMADLDLLLPDVQWNLDFEHRSHYLVGHHQAHVDDITLRAVDFGMDWDGDHASTAKDDISSIGIGRDASRATSIEPRPDGPMRTGGISMSRDQSPNRAALERDTAAPDFELPTFESVDLGEFGVGFEAQEAMVDNKVPSLASSPLTELPPSPQSQPAATEDDERVLTERKKIKSRKQIVDTMTELQDDEGKSVRLANDTDATGILADHQYLRNSSTMLQLLKIHDNPVAHFFRGKTKQHDTYPCDAPYGIGPELRHLFTRPTGRLHPGKRTISPQGDTLLKRRRIEQPDIEPIENASPLEFGRRGTSPAASLRLGSELLELEPEVFHEFRPPLSFGVEPFASHSQHSDSHTDAVPDGKGFSKNTMQALEIIQSELGSTGTERVLSFQMISDKASRRAAASFFFELLVLGTRDCLKLRQLASFEDIEFSAKEKFWTVLKSHSIVQSGFVV